MHCTESVHVKVPAAGHLECMPACLPSDFIVQAALVRKAVLWSSEYGLDCTQPFQEAFCDASSNACMHLAPVGLHQLIARTSLLCCVATCISVAKQRLSNGSKPFDCWRQVNVT